MDGTILFLILFATVVGAIFGGLVFGWTGAIAGAGVMMAVAMGAATPLL